MPAEARSKKGCVAASVALRLLGTLAARTRVNHYLEEKNSTSALTYSRMQNRSKR
jgi:hypothetical protein